MASFANVVLADGQATPVNHTFAPADVDSNRVFTYVDRASGIALGYPKITVKKRSPSKTSKVSRVEFRVSLPMLDTTVATNPVIGYSNAFQGTFFVAEKSSQAARADIYAYVKNLVASTLFSALVKDDDFIAG